MRGYFVFVLFACSAMAGAQDVNTDFQSFRKGLLGDFQTYRKGILDDYADYLDGIWKEYQAFRGEKRDDTPKPAVVPDVANEPVDLTPQTLPTPDVKPKEVPEEPSVPPIVKPVEPLRPAEAPTFDFSFYGVSLKGAKITTHHVSSLEPSAISAVWRMYQTDEYKYVIRSLTAVSQSYGLNDWFTFELVRCYVDAVLKNGTSSDRIVLQHFILANLGFDIRLASTRQQLLLLMPCKQLMYERSYLKVDNQRYYVFYDNLAPITESSAALSQENTGAD